MRSELVLAASVWAAFGGLGCGSDPSTMDTVVDASADTPADVPVDREEEPEVDAGPPPPFVCTEDMLAGGCTLGHCRLTAPRGTVPAGAGIELAERTLPGELAQDAYGTVLCDVKLSPSAPLSHELGLAITVDGQVDPAAALFSYKPSGGSALVVTSSAQAQGAVGIVSETGLYGVTKRSGAWRVEGYAGVDVDSTADAASVLRNISSRGVDAAYWDGTRLFVGNGARVLVYSGLPASPTQAPNLVLGQADLNTTSSTTSSSVFRGAVGGIWSDGTKLVVATGNRVLIWNTLPVASFTPADVVLGQTDFSSDLANSGGVSASSFSQPSQIDSDGTRLAVADMLNHRVLVWDTFPTAIGQPATSLIGQPSFTSNAIAGGALSIYQAWGVSLSGSGAYVSDFFGFGGMRHVATATAMNPAPDFASTVAYARVQPDTTYAAAGIAQLSGGALALRDGLVRRIGVFRSAPVAAGSIYDFVLGQPDPSRQISGPPNASASSNGLAYRLSGSGTRLLVPEGNRLLVFDAPSYNYEPASFVIGQAGFSSNGPVDYRGTGATTLASPADVAVNGSRVAVADRANNRVLIYDKADLPNKPAAAKVVLGQPDASSYVANGDIKSPSASRLSGPGGVALDATHLIVADTENHRVLIWSPVPTASGTAANVVLGQSDFSGRRPNHGRGDTLPVDGYSDAANNGFFYPTGVATDGTHLVVSDRLNHRLLVWNAIPTTNDAPADAVIGQATFADNIANRGAGPYSASPNGFDLPTGVSISGTTVWVADTENNRVVRVASAFTSPLADAWIGQPDGSTLANLNYRPQSHPNVGLATFPATTSATVLRPRGVVATATALYVTEQDSNRVHVLDPANFSHLGVLGQLDGTGATANSGSIGAASLSEPAGIAVDANTLFVADTKNHRVLGYDAANVPQTGAAASIVVGQPSEVSNGFNQASSASGSTSTKPRGMSRSGTDLFIADTAHHRVLVLGAPPKAGDVPTRVFGQPDANLVLPNAGGVPTARSLKSPRGAFADAQHVIIADTGNHRVLVFDRASTGPDAMLVLGQTSFGAVLPNAGGAPSLGTLAGPESAYSDGTRLFVADTGNHRVLVWNTFPTQNGKAADFVLGQSAADQVLSNRGTGAASADRMSSPTSIDVIGAALFVADSGNNRVLRFAPLPTASGALANAVLGQPDLTSRGSAAAATDKTHLAGPAALADDGANLYVIDRDVARVVVFSLPADTTGSPPMAIFGAAGGLNLSGPAGIAVERTPFFTSRVYVADTNDDRIVLLGSVSRLVGQ